MIWHGIWPFVLAVVRRKHLARCWVSNNSSRRQLDRFDYHHITADEDSDGWRRRANPRRRGNQPLCACPKCVEVFEPFLQWVRIA